MIGFVKKAISIALMTVAATGYATAEHDRVLQPLLGFPNIKQELSINPCANQDALKSYYGPEASKQAQDNLNVWPTGLCENQHLIKMLFNWQLISSQLLVHIERPSVVGNAIVGFTNELRSCQTTQCMLMHLPRMQEWAQTNFNRTPIVTKRGGHLRLKTEEINYPKLALRGLTLPLSNQAETCGGNAWDNLKFFTSSIIVANRVLTLATCADKSKSGLWLLEKRNNQPNWQEVLVTTGGEELFILPNSPDTYPEIFSVTPTESGANIVFFSYLERRGRYQISVSFDAIADELGDIYAFNIHSY